MSTNRPNAHTAHQLLEDSPAAWPAATDPALSQPDYDVIVMEDVVIPMRDGVRLVADIYRPARNGDFVREPLPILLERTPYDKRSVDRIARGARWFAQRGYIYVFQDCRGCYGSEGDMAFFWQEGPDGYDTVEWLAQQPWSNGKIGTTGTSYAAWTQNALAAYNPPHLTCMWVNEGASNGYTSTLRQGGALELRFLCWAFWHSATNNQAALHANPALRAALNTLDMGDILLQMPPKPGQTPLALAPAYEKWAFEILCRGDFDELWEDPSVNFELHWPNTADVPTVFSSAWYDSYTRANLESYVGLKAQKQGPYALLMGPWTHGDTPIGATFAGDVDLGPAAALDYNALRLRWFDHWLKGKSANPVEEAAVRYFVMGDGWGDHRGDGVARRDKAGRLMHGGRWYDAQDWPPPATNTPYYLHADGVLRPVSPAEDGDGATASTTYRFDPQTPVPTIGGCVSSLARLGELPAFMADPNAVPGSLRLEQLVSPGGFDQRTHAGIFGAQPPYGPLAARPDVLVFETAPLADAVTIIGPIEVQLWVASDAPDTDFTAKLVDVYPPSVDYPHGYALNITDGIQRMRYRDSWSAPSMMEAGEVYAVTIVLYPTANVFSAGHRIRLDISSSNFPRFDVNPNTGEPLGRNGRTQVANNTVYHSGRYASHVVLPIVTT